MEAEHDRGAAGGRGAWEPPGGREPPGAGLVTIGPRTTVFTLLREYPFLRERLVDRHAAFAPLAGQSGRSDGWARVTSLNDVAVTMDVPWRQLVREVRGSIEDELGSAPSVAGAGRAPHDDARLAELRAIVGELEAGGSLLELAERLHGVTRGMTQADVAALDEALASDADRVRDAAAATVARAAEEPDESPSLPGHPLDSQRRTSRQLWLLAGDLRLELERMGGSPSRRRWRSAKPMVQRLIDRIASVEPMFTRHRRAWFPALTAHGVEGLGALLADRESAALETIRRLRLATDRDDAAFVADAGARLVELLEDLLRTIDRVVVPLSERYLSEAEWRKVRRLEDSIGFALIPAPPAWPAAGVP